MKDQVQPDTVPPIPVQWQPEFDSGHAHIDTQHRHLFRCVNALVEAWGAGAEQRVLEHLDELIMHTIAHFRDEEAELERIAYAALVDHRRMHAMLLEAVLNFREGVLQGTGSIPQLIGFLTSEVVTRHMFEADRQYFPALQRG